MQDAPELLELYAPLMRSLNAYIVGQPPEDDVVTYRGSWALPGNFTPGSWYRFPMYVATSTSSDTAVQFFKQYAKHAVLEFLIPRGCLNGASLEPVTEFPGEYEYLLPPYTAAQCVDVGEKDFQVRGRVERVPWARFHVAADNRAVEAKFERVAKKYVNTQFYRVKQAAERRPSPSWDDVCNGLARIGADRDLGVLPFDCSVGRTCIKLYQQAHCIINKCLQEDSSDVWHLMPFLQSVDAFVQETPAPATARTMYRGFMADRCGGLLANCVERYGRPGEYVVLCKSFMSVTPDPDFLRTLIWQRLVFEIHVPAGCPWLRDVTDVTGPWEEEYMLMPYTMGRVVQPPSTNSSGSTTFHVELLGEQTPGAHILNALQVLPA